MAVKGRREEYAGVTRAAIVDAAINRFGEDGFGGTSIDAVADAARVSKGAVYHHFSDKAELFEAAFITMEERLQNEVIEAIVGITDPWALLRCGVDRFLEACAEAQFRRIVLEEAPAALGWSRWKEVEERYFLAMVSAAFEGLSEDGLIDVPPGMVAPRMFLAALSPPACEETERDAVADLVMRFVTGLS
jgi:AcrR family transcriptional regulator